MSTKQYNREGLTIAARFIIWVLVAMTVLFLIVAFYLMHWGPHAGSEELADFIIRAIVQYWFMGKW